jgi:hypothetical protein
MHVMDTRPSQDAPSAETLLSLQALSTKRSSIRVMPPSYVYSYAAFPTPLSLRLSYKKTSTAFHAPSLPGASPCEDGGSGWCLQFYLRR